ncbi:MAG: DNA-binding protein WhiA [Ruminococcus sp.]|nr:DNA-binding protein WhiA [Ruminococcus sp.]MBP3379605.1 DNA-binding protein WhiA [Ruminococcus sp.]
MSFSDEVRREICNNITDKDKRFACLYGMLLFSRVLSEERICFQSKSRIVADAFGKLFSRIFRTELGFKESQGKNGRIMYIFDITEKELIEQVFLRYHFGGGFRSIDEDIISTGSLGVFAAGVFLASGSVNNPEKEYHLEFTAPDESLAAELIALLGDIGVTAGHAVRRGQIVVYIKGSESIEDTLTFIGAQQCTLELMNVKIYKDVRNKANRIANCDNANINKTVDAAMKQVRDIRLIAETDGLDSLTDELREVAELRLDNVDMSLSDIGESLSVPISRSGVNHRFMKLAKIAENIRKTGAGK